MEKSANPTVTVIGGSGFIGSKLIKKLGFEKCINIDKNQSAFFSNITTIGDIRNSDQIVFNKETNAVILLAAEHRDDVHPTSLYYDVNVRGTKNVLAKMDRTGIKHLIFTSSVAIYGLNKQNPNENHIHDVAKWMFALSFLWSYLWFSQFMLIWYANIPEETTYFKVRMQGPYSIIFYANFIINFIICIRFV